MAIPVDLRQYSRSTFGGKPSTIDTGDKPVSIDYLADMAKNLHILAAMRTVGRGTITNVVNVGPAPVSILQSERGQGYTIINPTPSIGLTTTPTVLPSTAIIANGNTHLTPVGVASYDSMQMFLNVSSVVGAPTLNIYVQAADPYTGIWCDTQLLFSNIIGTGIAYANLGSNGIGTQFAVRWEFTGVGGESITCSIGAILKGGLGGSSSGTAQTVYIGAAGVTSTSGWSLLEGQSRDIYVEENSELFAVSDNPVNIKVIQWG